MAENCILNTDNLSAGYKAGKKETAVLAGLNLTLRQGELVCLLGANGIGKSTLLRTLSGVQPPLSGKIYVNEKELATFSPQQRSRLISIVYTDRTLAGALTVAELVSLGRHPYTGFFGRLDAEDKAVISHALETVGMAHKADCYVATLSDGERQKAMIARAFAQETPIIILDEPTAFLDVASRIETMKSLHQLARNENKAILLSSHDVNQSLSLANRLWLLRNDRTMIEGVTEDLVLNGELDKLFSDRQVTFAPHVGDFVAIQSFDRYVRLDCEDPLLRYWTGNALQRCNIGVSETAGIMVTAQSVTSFVVNGIEAHTITELLSLLKD